MTIKSRDRSAMGCCPRHRVRGPERIVRGALTAYRAHAVCRARRRSSCGTHEVHRRGARLPRRADLLRPPTGVRVGGARGGHDRARPPAGNRGHRPCARRARRQAPQRGRGARPRGCSGRSSWSATGRPGSRWCPTTPPGRSRADDRVRRRLQAGRPVAVHALQPTHVVPPCTTSEQEVRDGIAILDEALAVADRYTTA